MNKRIRRTATILLSAALLVTMSGATAWAAVDTEPVVNRDSDGVDVSYDDRSTLIGVLVDDGGSYTVSGDVKATSEYDNNAVSVQKTGSVTITGSVTSKGGDYSNAVETNGSYDMAGGSMAVTVNGDLISDCSAIHSYIEDGSSSTITIDGNVTAGKRTAIYLSNVQGTSTLVIGGSVSSSDSGLEVSEWGGNTSVRTGSITTQTTPVYWASYRKSDMRSVPAGTNQLTVDGNITQLTTSTRGSVMLVLRSSDNMDLTCTGTISGSTPLEISNNTLDDPQSSTDFVQPNITVWGLGNQAPDAVDRTKLLKLGAEIDPSHILDYDAIRTSILDSVHYIIRKASNIGSFDVLGDTLGTKTIGASTASGTGTDATGGTGSTATDGTTYQTAQVGSHVITVKPQAGYRLLSLQAGNDYTKVTDNGDGTYTLEVQDGGYLVLNAELEDLNPPAPAPGPTPAPSPVAPSTKPAASASAHASLTAHSFDLAPVTTAVITTYDKDGKDGKDGKETSKLVASSYEEFCQQLQTAIQAAPQDGKIVIATDKYTEVDLSALEGLEDRDDLALEVRYDTALDGSTEDLLGKDALKDGGSTYASVSVPAGSYDKIAKLAKQSKEGTKRVAFRALGEKFESEEISSIY